MAVRELTCVVHVHSLFSDGTGTVGEIAAAARAAGADAVVITDHDRTGALAQAGWHDGVLVAVGVEVSPVHGSHVLALGVERPIRHLGRTLGQIVDGVHAAGGAAFAAHPFSRGGWLLGRGRPAPFGDLRLALDGIEVWSLVTDTLEHIRSPLRLARFGLDPDAVLDDPPAANLRAWDALGATRRMPAIAGLDAHQYGIRRGGRVRLRTMAYARSFALLRTHALVEVPDAAASIERDPAPDTAASSGAPTPDAAGTTAALFAALAAGRTFLARDSLADATGFRFGSADGRLGMGDEAAFEDPLELLARAPAPAELRLLRDGEVVARADGARELRAHADRPGVYRISAHLSYRGRPRTWLLSNPLYLRA